MLLKSKLNVFFVDEYYFNLSQTLRLTSVVSKKGINNMFTAKQIKLSCYEELNK